MFAKGSLIEILTCIFHFIIFHFSFTPRNLPLLIFGKLIPFANCLLLVSCKGVEISLPTRTEVDVPTPETSS